MAALAIFRIRAKMLSALERARVGPRLLLGIHERVHPEEDITTQSRVGRSYTACMAAAIISKETSLFDATLSCPSCFDLPNAFW